jgi:hypothetical protein
MRKDELRNIRYYGSINTTSVKLSDEKVFDDLYDAQEETKREYFRLLSEIDKDLK